MMSDKTVPVYSLPTLDTRAFSLVLTGKWGYEATGSDMAVIFHSLLSLDTAVTSLPF